MNNASKKASRKVKQAKTAAAVASKAAKRATKAERKSLKDANRARVGASAAVARLSSEAAAIAGSLIAPDAFPACRLQDGYDNFPTALFEPKIVADIPFSTQADGTVDNLGYPNNEQWLFAFRQPQRGLVIPKHQNTVATSYILSKDGNTSFTRVANAALGFNGIAGASGGQILDDGYMYGAMPLNNGGDADGGYWPICYGCSVSQTANGGLPASTPVSISFVLCDGDENVFGTYATATTSATGTVTWALDNSILSLPVATNFYGYVNISGVSVACTNAAFTLNFPTNTCAPLHITLGNYLSVSGMIDEFRANGLGLTYTNTVNELNRQGEVTACQIPKGVSWPSLMLAGYSGLTKRPGARTMRADNGIQISWKPTSPEDMQFLDVGVSSTDSEYYSIVPESDYLAICISTPLAGRGGVVQVHCNAEGRTNSPWFASTVSPAGGRDATAQAMDLVRGYEQIHENPFHIRDAIAFLRKNKKGIGAVATALGAAVPTMAPLAAVINGALGAM